MKKEFTLALILLAVIVGITLGLTARYSSSKPVAQTSGGSCAVTMAEIIASAKGDVYNMAGASDFPAPESSYLAKYLVYGDKLSAPILEDVSSDLQSEQKNYALQNEAWQIFTDLIPPQNRQMVTQYNVFTDGFENTLAAADQTKNDLTHWVLEIDVADLQNKDALMFTLVHEYGHILTLDAAQMEPDQQIADNPTDQTLQQEKAAVCPNYFTGMGCSHADLYVTAFYNRFWLDINDEWQKVDALQYGTEDQIPYYNALYHFYQTHQDQFWDDYSATHPDEDVAEAFAYFVFSPKPTGNSIKEQKLAFFYQYPELVQLRQGILSGACGSAK